MHGYDSTREPGYRRLLAAGDLDQRVVEARDRLSRCDLCGLDCGVDRLAGRMGTCRTAATARVSSWGPHHGEEVPLRGWHGSGTIFFTRCTMRCVFCQNHDISQTDNGDLLEPADLAEIMLRLQARGCHNINLVTPTHVVPQILAAVAVAARRGLRIPLVYNTGGYDSLAALRLLDGVVDIYLPDMKYGDPAVAQRYSKVPNYPAVNQAAVAEMHRQVGDLVLDAAGLATRGLLVRHLVLPHGLAGTATVLGFLADEISRDTYVNLMDQYHPAYRAARYPEIDRRVTPEEFRAAVEIAGAVGLRRLEP